MLTEGKNLWCNQPMRDGEAEILRCAQDDECVDAMRCHSERSEEPLL
jgi:hypothetical protein